MLQNYENLNTVELQCIATSLIPNIDVSRYGTKPELIRKIKEKRHNFDDKQNTDFYYFEKDLTGTTCNLINPSSDDKVHYPFMTNSNKNQFADTKPVVPEPTLNRSRMGNLKFNVTFDESKGVHVFLNNVLRYADFNNISTDKDKILIVFNGISNSESG